MIDATKAKQHLADHVNANSKIMAYCAAITNTHVPALGTEGAWYAPFMQNLGVAQQHADQFLNNIGPDCWSAVPEAIQNCGQTQYGSMSAVQAIVATLKPGQILTATQISDIVQCFQAVQQQVEIVLGKETDSNLPPNNPASPTIWGCVNDLKTFTTNLQTDNTSLTTGQQGAAKEVGILHTDAYTTLKGKIKTLIGEIKVWDHDIELAEIGIGASIFVAIVGIALAPETGGASLVVTFTGVVGLGGSIAATVVYSDQVKEATAKLQADQAKQSTEEQQITALNGVIHALGSLSEQNVNAQLAVGSLKDLLVSLRGDAATAVTKLTKADSGTTLAYLETLDIEFAMNAWNDLATLASSILNMTKNQQTLTPPSTT